MTRRMLTLVALTLCTGMLFAQRGDFGNVMINDSGQAVYLDVDVNTDGSATRVITGFNEAGDIAWTYGLDETSEVWNLRLMGETMTFYSQSKELDQPAIVALDASSGEEKWRLPVAGTIRDFKASGSGFYLQYITTDVNGAYHHLGFVNSDGQLVWDRVVNDYPNREGTRRDDQDDPNAPRTGQGGDGATDQGTGSSGRN